MVAIRNAYRPGPPPLPSPAPTAKVIELTAAQRLLKRIEGFMRAHPEVTRKAFGRRACANEHLVDRLEDGLGPAKVTVERVEAFIAGYR